MASLLVLAGCGGDDETSPRSAEGATVPTRIAGVSDGYYDARAAKEAWMGELGKCLKGKGWEFQIDERLGSIGVEGATRDQIQAFRRDSQECEAGRPNPFETAVTRESARDLYLVSVAAYKCLLARGYSPEPPPSEEKFIDSYLVPDPKNPPWGPYEAINTDSLNSAEWLELQNACPQA